MSAKSPDVKKVKAYPISAVLKGKTTQMSASIMKLAEVGFLAELSSGVVTVGDKFDFTFELPVMHKVITGEGVVVKVYNQFSGGTGSLVTAEIHYRTLSTKHREQISVFMRAATQTGS